MLLEAEFLAAIQVLVYIGAVAILLMFGIMLTRNIQGDDTTIVAGRLEDPGAVRRALRSSWSWSSGSTTPVGAGRAEPLVGDATSGRRSPPSRREPGDGRPPRGRSTTWRRTVGNELMTRYAVAFEVAGLLLTAALVGAIALAHREEDEPSRTAPRRARSAADRRSARPRAAGPIASGGDLATGSLKRVPDRPVAPSIAGRSTRIRSRIESRSWIPTSR